MKKSFTIAAITLGFLLPLAAIAAVDPAPANVLTTPDYCPSLMRNLFRGRQGSDVQALQRYLIFQQLLPSDSSTGFFGPATESAVRNWQKAQGIVSLGDAVSTGWGVVGARTRAAIAVQCKNVLAPTLPMPSTAPSTPSCPIAPPPSTICSTGWQANTDPNGCTTSYRCSIPLPGLPSLSSATVPQTSDIFGALPTSGASPLTVTFRTNIQNPTSYAGGVYKIDYGDNRVDNIAGCSLASVCTLDSGTHTHTYAAGTYTARLIFVDRSPYASGSSNYASGQTLNIVTIVAGN